MIINVCSNNFTIVLTRCIHIRCIIIAPSIYEILIIARENSSIPAFLIGETLNLSISMTDVNLTIVRIQCCSLIINIARFFIYSIHICDIKFAIANLTFKSSCTTIQIKLHEAIAVRRKQNIVFAQTNII